MKAEVDDGISLECFLKPRRIGNQNVVHRLYQRETHLGKPGTQFHCARRFYTNVFPNFTVVNVEKPPCFLRKFSPDGRYFVAFSADQTSIEIYSFEGSAAAESLMKNVKGDIAANTSDPKCSDIRSKLFEKFFKLRCTAIVATNGGQLNRECSLFTDDGKFVIVGSAQNVPEDPHPLFFDTHRNNEAVNASPRSPLEDYCLHIVELESGLVCDYRSFKYDKIFLSHNQGLYLYKNTLAVLSVLQQTIHIFHVTSRGEFIDVRSIGRFCYEDDGRSAQTQYMEKTMNSLKHRLLVFLYTKAKTSCSAYELRKFYQYFEQFASLKMWKMQLLDENHLLIKYASEDVVTLKIPDPNSQPSFFVVYNMATTEVVAVNENTSDDLLQLFENHCDMFRNATLHTVAHFTCSSSSNLYARQIQQRYKQTIINAKFGGNTEAVKRLLAQLPISAQSYSSSPYLDLALFSYDDKWVSVMERPKPCGKNTQPTARRLVAFTFHPSEPFAISVQRTNSEYVVNFHIRHVYVPK
ncbi:DET1-like protein [Mya arenaria]|uniref:DET1-like protein n=1 Tax=Mya arenaria TaxID=6604 RepID=A0ABY7DS10_MYAAR|nr:DET1-like protein [Mya arenaria]